MEFRLQKTLTVTGRDEHRDGADARAYWRTRTPEERLAAVEFLRRQVVGPGTRLQRVLRVIDRQRG